MAELFLMIGCPGAGKSTFLKNNVNKESSEIVSRDKIRFSLLQENDHYFAREEEVLMIFYDTINKALKEGKNVFVDQTSLTPKAREKLLEHLWHYDAVNAIWIDEPLDICLARNAERQGTRGFVPESEVCKMHHRLVPPSLDEGFKRIYRYNSKEGKITYIGEKI